MSDKNIDICMSCPHFVKLSPKNKALSVRIGCKLDEVLTMTGLSVGTRHYTERQFVRTEVPDGCMCKLEYVVLNTGV